MLKNKADKRIKCNSCRFVKKDKSMSKFDWIAYKCGKHESEYYQGILNLTPNGDMLNKITWCGCPFGKRGKSQWTSKAIFPRLITSTRESTAKLNRCNHCANLPLKPLLHFLICQKMQREILNKSNSGHLDNSNLITLCTQHHAIADRGEISYEEIKNIICEQELNKHEN